MTSKFLPTVVLLLAVAIVYLYTKNSQIIETTNLNYSYDYIIVGGGSSGLVLANRLSEDSESTVLLIEAGGLHTDNQLISVPLASIQVQKSEQDWKYLTEPQKHACKGLIEQRSAWPRGKVLGGSSCLNYMIYIRGSPHDFDSWAAKGCNGWSYKDVLPYFIKSEDIQIPELKNSKYHGKRGPLTVTNGTFTPLSDMYRRGMEELGYKTVDCNGETQDGFCYMQYTVKNGERWSTSKAFLEPVLDRKNLHVSLNSHVTKVVIENKKATGVEFIRDGRKHRIMSNKEVILSAGAVNSPQILMLSGIGPRAHLESLGIPVYADLPVGQNLQDHVITVLGFFVNGSYGITEDKIMKFTNILNYLIFKQGFLASNGLEGSGFLLTYPESKDKFPDIQLHFYSASPNVEVAHTIKAFNMPHEVLTLSNALNMYSEDKVGNAVLNRTGLNNSEEFKILPVLLHPKSRGTIQLKSIDPFDPPVIDPHYLEDPDDVKTMVRGVKVALKLANTSAFRQMGITPEDTRYKLPFCNEYTFPSDEYLECFARHITLTLYHPTSTCKMGAHNDKNSVVDPTLRVKGISNLRVADASIMPAIVSGNTNSACIMIAEKAADLIKGIDSVQSIRENVNL